VRFVVPDNVAWVRGVDFTTEDTSTYVMVVPHGHPAALTGVGAAIWDLAVTGEDVIEGIAGAVGQDPADIAAEVRAFVTDLMARGFLMQIDD